MGDNRPRIAERADITAYSSSALIYALWQGVKRIGSGPILTFVLAVVFFIQSLRLPYYSKIGPSAGFFGLWTSLILGVAAISWALTLLRSADSDDEGIPPRAHGSFGRIIGITAAVLVFGILIKLAGYVIATTITAMIVLITYRVGTVKAFLISLAIAVSQYYLFVWLGVPLPAGLASYIGLE